MLWSTLALGFAAAMAPGLPTDANTESDATNAAPAFQFELNTSDSLNIRRQEVPEASSAVLTIVPTEQILEYSLTLSDYLRFVPGFDPVDAFWVRWPALRGLTGSVNFMVDGVSLTSPLDYRYEAGAGLFLEEFDKAEITTGPAGVLWGPFSLLGTVNLRAGTPVPGTRLYAAAGVPGIIHTSVDYATELGPGRLRLFAGYRQIGHYDRTPTLSWAELPPYGRDWRQIEATGTLSRVAPPPDRFAVVSGRYSTRNVVFYFRLPVAKTYFNSTELGAVVPTGNSGSRTAIDGMAYVSVSNAFLNGQLRMQGRLSWYLLREVFDRALLPNSTLLPGGARVLSEATISRVGGLFEASYRFQRRILQIDFLAGADLTLEVPHSSSVASPNTGLGGAITERGPMLENDAIATVSPYIFVEPKLWQRLSLATGLRYNNAGSTYQDVVLYQGSVGLRALGKSYLKFGITEGMRPPQLPDRSGITPVRKADSPLDPERSRSLTIELNTTVEDVGPFHTIFSRLTMARTTTQDNIVRETFLLVPFEDQPVNVAGLEIDSIEASTEMRLRPGRGHIQLSYRYNQVRDARARSGDAATVAQALLENPLCGKSVCANRGPKHRVSATVAADLATWVRGSASMAMQCGGKSAIVRALPDGSQPPQAAVENATVIGCYPIFGIGGRFPAKPQRFNLVLRAENIVGNTPPAMLFSQASLSGGEGGQRTTRTTRFYAMLTWRPGGSVSW